VLGVLGKATPDRVILSDRVCTALQIAEHLQDVAEDYAAGRIYLPLEDLDTFGVTEADLGAPVASQALRNLMAFQVARATTILDQGAPLASLLQGRMRLAIAGFIGGGRAALQAVRQAGYDVLGGAPKASKQQLAGAALWVAVRSYAPSMRAGAAAAGALTPLCDPPPPTPNPSRAATVPAPKTATSPVSPEPSATSVPGPAAEANNSTSVGAAVPGNAPEGGPAAGPVGTWPDAAPTGTGPHRRGDEGEAS
jgi:hypothetical protein